MKIRVLLLGAVSAVALATMSLADSITVVSWGGAYTKSQVEAYHKPWASSTGNSVVSEDYSGGLAEVRAQVEAGNVTWDVVDVELSDAIVGCDEGLLEEIDASTLPAANVPWVTSFGPRFMPMIKQNSLSNQPLWLISLT